MIARARFKFWRDATRGAVRDPKLLAGIAAHMDEQLAAFLAHRLPQATARSLAGHVMSQDHAILEFERDGLRWKVDMGDEIGRELYATGSYEGEEIAAVLRWLDRKGIIVDLGANIGTTSIPFALAGYDVIAVEPVPATFSMLSNNVERNGLADRITCIQSAVATHQGPVTMWTGFASGQAEVAVDGATGIERWGDRGELITVLGGPVESIVGQSDVALVWADVQGSEIVVVETGAYLWERGVPLYLEIDPSSLELHGGLERFEQGVRRHFAAFLPRDDLITGGSEQDIARFGAFLATIDTDYYSDALLIPHHATVARRPRGTAASGHRTGGSSRSSASSTSPRSHQRPQR
jgi:FkbM family methyltransferase